MTLSDLNGILWIAGRFPAAVFPKLSDGFMGDGEKSGQN